MELAIKNKYIKVEAGAQGAHKIKRGYLPKITYSAHYIFNEKLKLAIKNFLTEEREIVLNDINHINDNYSPLKLLVTLILTVLCAFYNNFSSLFEFSEYYFISQGLFNFFV